MGYSFSKSKYVAACTHCHKYAWLDKYRHDVMEPVSEYTQYLFDNGHRVGDLAQQYFGAQVDVSATKAGGKMDLDIMKALTDEHMRLGTEVIAEASFSYKGYFCSVDILRRNPDGTYDMYEVKSSKQLKPTKKNPTGVKEDYLLDASYQQYVLTHCHVPLRRVHVVVLNRDYVRHGDLELSQYFKICDVTAETTARQKAVEDNLNAIGLILADPTEPASVLSKSCNHCPFWGYCGQDIPTPSPFDVYNIHFDAACKLYNQGVSFYDVPKHMKNPSHTVKTQIAYHDRPDEVYVDKTAVQSFLDTLSYPLYSLDFETYQASIPAYEELRTGEQVPFQYSLHVVPAPDADLSAVTEYAFLDLSGTDTRRAIAESLVERIPFGACVMAYHKSTEAGIVEHLAQHCPDLAAHLRSFTYVDPLKVFQDGHYYTASMGKSFSLKAVLPALYPDDPDMDYHNLEGNVKNGTQAMNVYTKAADYTEEEKQRLEEDLKKYCALDTLAVVKIIKKLYEVVR